jgi:hypothetical protein
MHMVQLRRHSTRAVLTHVTAVFAVANYWAARVRDYSKLV